MLKLRFSLDQYINLRPVKLYNSAYCPLKDKKPEDIDFVVVRENSEGLYKGMGVPEKDTKMKWPIQISIIPAKGWSAACAMPLNIPVNAIKGKTHPLRKDQCAYPCLGFVERTRKQVAKEYPDITTDYAHVDAATMWFVKNPSGLM